MFTFSSVSKRKRSLIKSAEGGSLGRVVSLGNRNPDPVQDKTLDFASFYDSHGVTLQVEIIPLAEDFSYCFPK